MRVFSIIINSWLFTSIAIAQIHDLRIPSSTEQYFRLNRKGPTLVSSEIIDSDGSGRTLKLHIIARRHCMSFDLGFAFAAAAAVANLAARPIDKLWVQMDINYKDIETTIATAQAYCTIDAMIMGNCELTKWWDNCLKFP
ncbi:hypothetical protein HQ531_08050 [bacterium]|nr:hypothetical protein [bacterium]